MDYYLYYIGFGIVLVLCFVYMAYARKHAGRTHEQMLAEGYTVEHYLYNSAQTREELLSDPSWFLFLRQKLEPEHIMAFTHCTRYEGPNEKAGQLAEWIFWRAVTTYKNAVPETYTCYLVLTDQAMHYLQYDAYENCRHHLALPRQQIQRVNITPVQDLPIIERLWHLNQTFYSGGGLYKLSLTLTDGKQVGLIYMDGMYFNSIPNSPTGYMRMVQGQAMGQYFHQEIINL